jgi:hypothetical protein
MRTRAKSFPLLSDRIGTLAHFVQVQVLSSGWSCHARQFRAEGERRQARNDRMGREFGRARWCRVFAVIPCFAGFREARNRLSDNPAGLTRRKTPGEFAAVTQAILSKHNRL